MLAREATTQDRLYLVVDGWAKVLKHGVQIATAGPGEFVGEVRGVYCSREACACIDREKKWQCGVVRFRDCAWVIDLAGVLFFPARRCSSEGRVDKDTHERHTATRPFEMHTR